MSNNTNGLEELSNFIVASKYARFRKDLGRRELWDEIVNRTRDMHLNHFQALSEEDKLEIVKAFEFVRQKYVVPSMRSLQFGGKAIETINERSFNCASRHIDSIRSFAEVFFMLLCGAGVTFGLNKYFLARLPDLVNAEDKTGTVLTYVVDDTIQGWANSLEALLSCYFRNTAFTGRKIVFDFSKIRKKGTLLHTSGGRAPGYKGLKQALLLIKKLLDHIIEDNNQTRLRSIDAYDILMHTSDAVLSGGIRRAATAVIFDEDDEDMLTAKSDFIVEKIKNHSVDDEEKVAYVTFTTKEKMYRNIKFDISSSDYDYKRCIVEKLVSWYYVEPQRARSNNSVLILKENIDKKKLHKIFNITKFYGEPGFVLGDHPHQLLNPCQPKWAPILTKDGLRQMEDINKGTEIWSETGWVTVAKKWSTGIKKVYRYRTNAGVFYGTENHRVVQNGSKVEAKDAEAIDVLHAPIVKSVEWDADAVMAGLMIGDGTKFATDYCGLCIGIDDQDYFRSEVAGLIGDKYAGMGDCVYKVQSDIVVDELSNLPKRKIPSRYVFSDSKTTASFLRGLFSANGSLCGNRITLKTTSTLLLEQVQVMLSGIGIRSYYTTNKAKIAAFNNGEYGCKESYDLNITADREIFLRCVGFIQSYKQDKLTALVKKLQGSKRVTAKITYNIHSVELVSEEEVFDITVDNEPHTYWTGGCNVSNCFEVNFIPVTKDGICGVQVCNLTSINGAKVKTLDDWKNAAKVASLIGTLQAAYTHFPFLNTASKELTEEEALLGVSITGMMDNPKLFFEAKHQQEVASIVKDVNEEWSKKIGINPAARTTLIKPEGSSSLVLQSASGIHPHHSRKYIRRVQCNHDDPVYNYFNSINPHACERSVWSASGTDDVISFPLEIPDDAITKADLSALEHLELVKQTQINWVIEGTTKFNKKPITHNVSCTILVKEDEWEEVCNYVYDNKKYFTAISFLPDTGDISYPQAPLQAIKTEEDEVLFQKLKANWKFIDYSLMIETSDHTKHTQEAACAGGACELIKI